MGKNETGLSSVKAFANAWFVALLTSDEFIEANGAEIGWLRGVTMSVEPTDNEGRVWVNLRMCNFTINLQVRIEFEDIRSPRQVWVPVKNRRVVMERSDLQDMLNEKTATIPLDFDDDGKMTIHPVEFQDYLK